VANSYENESNIVSRCKFTVDKSHSVHLIKNKILLLAYSGELVEFARIQGNTGNCTYVLPTRPGEPAKALFSVSFQLQFSAVFFVNTDK
jgi:hypothetical protein